VRVDRAGILPERRRLRKRSPRNAGPPSIDRLLNRA
jgi:hypothetical protein